MHQSSSLLYPGDEVAAVDWNPAVLPCCLLPQDDERIVVLEKDGSFETRRKEPRIERNAAVTGRMEKLVSHHHDSCSGTRGH